MHGLDVAVIGGGIGGLTTAVALRQAGHHAVVYEQTAQLRAAGAGISVWSNGVKALNLLGLGPGMEALSGRMDRMAYAAKDGDPLCDFSLAPMVEQAGQRPCPISRTALQNLLTNALGPSALRLNRRCIGLELAGAPGATVVFEDGSRVSPDVVVAADGTHSRLRNYVVGHSVQRRYVGYVNWNGLVDWSADLCAPDTWLTWVGDGKRVSLMPVGEGRCYFFFDVPLNLNGTMPSSDGAPVAAAGAPEAAGPEAAGPAAAGAAEASEASMELSAHFAGWAAPVLRLIERLDPAAVNRVPIFDHDPLPRFNRGTVALVGDAAHSMSPDLGQGGCQAMEDALVLTRCLTANTLGVPDALARYDQVRTHHTADIVHRARKRSDVTHGVDPARTAAWYQELAGEDGTTIIAGLVQSVLGGPLG